tara:strand:+ start:489 stop:749 length:261 start_codon:yes stop_codon:yes gene_type:complete
MNMTATNLYIDEDLYATTDWTGTRGIQEMVDETKDNFNLAAYEVAALTDHLVIYIAPTSPQADLQNGYTKIEIRKDNFDLAAYEQG